MHKEVNLKKCVYSIATGNFSLGIFLLVYNYSALHEWSKEIDNFIFIKWCQQL